ncbi:phage holin family protein [Streptomyces sp. NBC_01498]|uniref:phage holin family protein n=1 Tax=Streptomyces sp. NBC_01498 TaxID=2975870 RepID=UPI002E7AF197|nr:phage holin family protein [Streptomyces sp. NBC_01498]WTL23252.1 phage holin family protein [Streptomyces sp. NBC_01498]
MSPQTEKSAAELVQQTSEQLSALVREELRLATAEMKEKGRRAGRGGGLFGGAALVGALALQALVVTVIAALALVVPVWVSALIVTAVLALIAAVLAGRGRRETRQATPLAPEQTAESVKADIEEIKERAHR